MIFETVTMERCFYLKNDFQTPTSLFLSLRVGFLLHEKNHFSFPYAPLKILETDPNYFNTTTSSFWDDHNSEKIKKYLQKTH
jgi:hypothetical protein